MSKDSVSHTSLPASRDMRDARRYRTLRANLGYNLGASHTVGKFQVSQQTERGEAHYLYGELLDDALDECAKNTEHDLLQPSDGWLQGMERLMDKYKSVLSHPDMADDLPSEVRQSIRDHLQKVEVVK